MKRNPSLNGVWIIYKNKKIEFYSLVKDGYYYIYITGSDNVDNSEILWLFEGYSRLFPLWIVDNEVEPECYLLLENSKGEAFVMEIVNKKIIIDGFFYSDYLGFRQEINGKGFDMKITDTIVGIADHLDYKFYLYSLRKGFIFGPYPYNEIEKFAYGFILDKNTAINYNGQKFDITGYVKEKKVGNVFYNEEKMKCLLIIGKSLDFTMLIMEPCSHVEFLFSVTHKDVEYTYNIIKQKLSSRNINDDLEDDIGYQWSASDSYYAFEGHSELELGID